VKHSGYVPNIFLLSQVDEATTPVYEVGHTMLLMVHMLIFKLANVTMLAEDTSKTPRNPANR
jgi:hypothetical protein